MNHVATRRLLAIVLAACAIFSFAGYLLKAQCIGEGKYNALRDRRLCSNDIQVLYLNRDLHAKRFPYLHGELVTVHNSDGTSYDTLTGGTLEYPVLTGVFAWFPSLFVNDDGGYLQVTALLLVPFSLLTAYLLSRMVRWRALIYALAPPLIWYSFHNWDLLVVCATVGAFYAWWKQRYTWTAILLAVGGSLKLWPIFFVLPFVLERLYAKDRNGAAAAAVNSVLATLVINGGIILASPKGWYAPYAFQKDRAADITSNSLWYWAFSKPVSTGTLNTVVPVLLVLGILLACGVGWWRAQQDGVFPFLQVCGAILCVFMVTNKAHSPQYALWLLPFFVLIRVRWGWWLAYLVIDVCMYVGLFRWYWALTPGSNLPQYGRPYDALVIGVFGRAVMLVLLFWVFLRSDTALEPSPVREPLPREPVPA